MKQHYKELLLIALMLLCGLFARLYRFNNPIADWHSWRQSDTSAVSRNFIKYGFDLLHPRMNNISNVQSGIENPQGYFYAEFPLYNAAQAGLFKIFGLLTLEEWGRLVTIIMSLLGSLFLYLLVKRRGFPSAAWYTFMFAVFIPYNIYYGRTILPDSSMVAAIIGGIFFLDTWLDGFRKKSAKPQIAFLFLSLLFTVVAFLLKPYAVFYTLPMFVLVFTVLQWNFLKKWELWVFAILSVLPLFWWRNFMRAYPEGIPANVWLLNGNGIRFRPAFFRWIFYERLTKLISGYAGVLLLVLGVPQILKEKKSTWFFLSFPVAALLYICIFATGNVQHDYYQIVIMPSVAILCGFGATFLVSFLQKYMRRYIAYAIVGVLIFVGFWLGWIQVKDYFNINNPSIVVAGQAVNRLTPKDALVIAPYNGDSSFLYQTNR
ncbi:MAG: glycosyltransferase family 39 protein, partial [Patescibacteria group bacterium]|nr:glycosyltransferase family 39 protein [Patescibacteria group bacterium]